MARLGYRYEEAITLPVWLFWSLSKTDGKDVTRQQALSYESTGLSFGSFSKSAGKDIRRRWEEALKSGYEKEPISKEQKQKNWAEVAKWLS